MKQTKLVFPVLLALFLVPILANGQQLVNITQKIEVSPTETTIYKCPTEIVDCVKGAVPQSYIGDDGCTKWKCIPQTEKCPQELVNCVKGTVPQSYIGDDGCTKWRCVPQLPIEPSCKAPCIKNGETCACPEYPQITEQFCDATKPCPEWLECSGFPGFGLRCAEPNPCSYFKCPKGTQCTIAESYPGQVMCNCVGPECPAVSNAEEPISYDLRAQTAVRAVDQNQQTVSRNISLWKTTPGNKGVLSTSIASVEYSNELVIEESKLFMKTSAGKEPINVMPEAAIAVSETPNTESIQKIELKEESQKPIYNIEGVKAGRILFVFPVKLKIKTKVDAGTGNVISVKKPWYSFLAW